MGRPFVDCDSGRLDRGATPRALLSAAGAGAPDTPDTPIFVRASDGSGAPSFPDCARDVLTRDLGCQSGAEVTLRFYCRDELRGVRASRRAARLMTDGAAR